MAIIDVRNLTFSYDSHYENIFEQVSFSIDTDWKLGFIGRNGRGKTTFLKLLKGEYTYKGEIVSSVDFDYFPFEVDETKETLEVIKGSIAPYSKWEEEMQACITRGTEEALERYGTLLERYMYYDGYTIEECIEKEIGKLGVQKEVLYRPFDTLSGGEKTKLLLASLFLKKNNFLLIDEPTNHLDVEGREVVAAYLKEKKGFILVSHDRMFLNEVIDHVLCINREKIEVQKGNYSTWQMNKEREDQYEQAENVKLKKEVSRLEAAARKTIGWSDKVERSKLGAHVGDRGFVGAQSAKMMKRAKSIMKRQERAMDDKKKLMKNIEQVESLKMHCVPYIKKTLVAFQDVQLKYEHLLFEIPMNFTIEQGERIFLTGKNGCGKSSIIKALLGEVEVHLGYITKGSQLKISYVPQDASFLQGDMRSFIRESEVDETLFKTILRKLDFSREAFDKDLGELSGGQKKKVLLARSLAEEAHLYIWDEPLNYIDVLSRGQIEDLILRAAPTMLIVEHDRVFRERIATKCICLS